jgi:uncharacterized protein
MSDLISSATSYEVTVNGTVFKQTENDGLQSLVVEDHIDMVDMLTLKVGGAEGQPTWSFNIGDPVEAKLGAGSIKLFEGEITSIDPGFQVEGVSSMTIRALDKVHRLGRGRKTRFWLDMKDSDVATEVGADSGLSVDADTTADTLPYILQRNESNVAFLKRLAARNNFVLRVEEGKLLFKKASFGGAAETFTMGENLRSARFSFNTADMVQKVVVRGWDITKKEEIVGEATTGDITKIGGGQLGADVAAVFGDSTAYITDVPVTEQGLATSIAKAEMERLARQFCHGSAVVSGTDKVYAGSMVKFEGLSGNLNGTYFVVATRHIVSNRSGYSTELTFCSNTYGS